jgi:hypothetical protein
VAEHRYQAVLGVLSKGRAVMRVASQRGVSRRTVHRWLGRYEAEGWRGCLTAPIGRSGVSTRCPSRSKSGARAAPRAPYSGARRLALELVRKQVTPAPSESAVYRCLVRAGVIDPVKRHRILGRQRAGEDGGSANQGRPQEARRSDHAHESKISMRMRHINRTSFATDLPKVLTLHKIVGPDASRAIRWLVQSSLQTRVPLGLRMQRSWYNRPASTCGYGRLSDRGGGGR